MAMQQPPCPHTHTHTLNIVWQWAQAVGFAVCRRSGDRLATALVATIFVIILFLFSTPFPPIFYVVYISHRRSAQIKTSMYHRAWVAQAYLETQSYYWFSFLSFGIAYLITSFGIAFQIELYIIIDFLIYYIVCDCIIIFDCMFDLIINACKFDYFLNGIF